MLEMVHCLDSFSGQQSRLVIVVDGLDSCEQSKVLSVLDAVQTLFSDPGAPFIILLAIDPHVIIKAIELNLNQAFSDTSINGNSYLRNLVHLPFFLQNAGLRKVKVAQNVATQLKNKSSSMWLEIADETGSSRKLSNESNVFRKSGGKNVRLGGSGRGNLGGGDGTESVASSIGNNLNKVGGGNLQHGPQDLTKVLLSDDYFSDVNPRSMRRLMNVLYVMGRLLKAFNIDFNWYRLSAWVNITEQWPYRLSWIILFVELNEDSIEETASLKQMFDRIRGAIPTQKEVEPLLELDRDEKKMDAFLSYHKKSMTVSDLRVFLPFSINLDPYVKKVIKDEVQNIQEISGMSLEHFLSAQQSSSNEPAKGIRASLLASNPSNASLGMPTAPPLTRRQAMGLSRRMSQGDLNRTLAHSGAGVGAPGAGPSNMLFPQVPFMYGLPQAMQQASMWPGAQQFGGAGAMNPGMPFSTSPPEQQQQQMQRQPSTGSPPPPPTRSSPPPAVRLGEEMSLVPLSRKTTEDVCTVLSAVAGLSHDHIDDYCTAVKSNNLNGAVLSGCDLSNELKTVMGMSFGDWEVFKTVVTALRADEKNKASAGTVKFKLGDDPLSPHFGSSKGASLSTNDGGARDAARQKSTSPDARDSTPVPSSSSSVNYSRPLGMQRSISIRSPMEKQITMEDAMISGSKDYIRFVGMEIFFYILIHIF